MITVNTTGLEQYADHLRAQLVANRRAQSILLNDMAFSLRTRALSYIPSVMTVRNSAFLSRSMRVTRSTASTLRSSVGTIATDRFSGLAEQEFGGMMQRQSAMTRARVGGSHGTIAQGNRFRGNIIKPSDIQVAHERSAWQRNVVLLEQLQRRGETRPFILMTSGGYKSGLFRLGKLKRRGNKGKIKHMWRGRNEKGQFTTLDAVHHTTQDTSRQLVRMRSMDKGKKEVRQKKWMRPALDAFLAQSNLLQMWAAALSRANAFSGSRRRFG